MLPNSADKGTESWQLGTGHNTVTFGITMSSATTLLQSSDVESSSTTSEADASSLEAALTTTHTVKMLMDRGESKVSYG